MPRTKRATSFLQAITEPSTSDDARISTLAETTGMLIQNQDAKDKAGSKLFVGKNGSFYVTYN